MMKKFATLYEASNYAVTLCSAWKFSTSNEFYDTSSLQETAKIHDKESMDDEDSFYVVSDSGAIGFCIDSDTDIDWYFIRRDNPDEDLPNRYIENNMQRYCTNCGKPAKSDARFCIACGQRLV